MNHRCALAVLAAAFMLPAAAEAQTAPACAPDGTASFLCNLNLPEDLLAIPGSPFILVAWHGEGGGLHLIDTRNKRDSTLYPVQPARARWDRKRYSDCPGPPDAAFLAKWRTHGIGLIAAGGGRHRLYVVNHGPRESVEIFELDTRGRTPTATWIGCSVAPDKSFNLNSVVGLPDGGFIVTSFSHRGVGGPDSFARLAKGENSGELWEWHPGGSWTKVPGSDSAGPNGLALSPDGKWLFIGSWGGQSLIRLARGAASPKRDTLSLGFRVDNLRWAPDGSLFVAGQSESPSCVITTGPCMDGGTIVVKVDPHTLKATKVVDYPNSDTWGFGTSAIQVGDRIWVGSYRKNAIGIFPAPR